MHELAGEMPAVRHLLLVQSLYEYSPSGNDEEAHLRRLPAAEALASLIAAELYPELEDWARRGAAYAKTVLMEINRSKLKRDTVEFQALQSVCKAIMQK